MAQAGSNVPRPYYHAPCAFNCLPPEIVVHIFSFVPYTIPFFDVHLGRSWSVEITNLKKLLPLMAVSRHWRDVIMSTPALWSNIWHGHDDDDGPGWGSRYLHRCTRGPVNLYSSGGFPQETTELLGRIRQLHISGGRTRENLTVLRDLLVPALQGFSLVTRERFRTTERHASFFGGGGERLQTLKLGSLPILPSNRFPALTHFNIRICSKPNWNAVDLLRLLSFSPALQELHIVAYCKNCPPSTEGLAAATPVKLDLLRAISFSVLHVTEVEFTRDLLSRLILPVSCRRYFDQLDAAYMQILAAALSPPGMSIKRVQLTLPFHDEESRNPATLKLVGPHDMFNSKIRLYRDGTGTSIGDELKHNLADLPALAGIEEFWLSANSALDDVRSILPTLTKVRGLVISTSSLFWRWGEGLSKLVIKTLSVVPGESITCPSLDTLCLLLHAPDEELVLEMLRSRAEAGPPMRRLVLGFAIPHYPKGRNLACLDELKKYVDDIALINDVFFWEKKFSLLGKISEAFLLSSSIRRDWPI